MADTRTENELPSSESSELLRTARELVPLLARNAEQGERDRRLTDESVKSLTAGGMFRLAVPKRYGGHEVSLRTLADVSATLAEGDGSASWVVAVGSSLAWVTSLFPEQAQDEVFGADPDTRISGVLTPSATAERVDGGYRVSGRWHYASGSWHAGWSLIGFPVPDSTGRIVDQGMALIPAADYTVEDTWFVAGMRATGSNCLVAQDIFVPDHRVVSVPKAMAGDYPVQRSGGPHPRSAFVQFLTAAPWRPPSSAWAVRRWSWSGASPPRRPSRSPTSRSSATRRPSSCGSPRRRRRSTPLTSTSTAPPPTSTARRGAARPWTRSGASRRGRTSAGRSGTSPRRSTSC